MKISQVILGIFLTVFGIVFWRANQIIGNFDSWELIVNILGIFLTGLLLFSIFYFSAQKTFFAFLATVLIVIFCFTAAYPIETLFVRLRWKIAIEAYCLYEIIFYCFLLAFFAVLSSLIIARNKIEIHVYTKHITSLFYLLFALEGLYLGGKVLYMYQKVGSFSERKALFSSLKKEELPAQFPPKDSLPDIYFLLFDECVNPKIIESYGIKKAKTWYSSLKLRGFFTADSTLSNYAFTAKSMPSIFNMYEGMEEIYPNEWNFRLMDEAKWGTVLTKAGYEIYNYSIFRFAGKDKNEYVNGYPVAYRSLWDYIYKRSVFCQLEESRYELVPKDDTDYLRYRLKACVNDSIAKPKFVYIHFTLPHEPFRYRADGSKWDKSASNYPKREDLFAEQSVYAFDVMQECVDFIQQKTNGKAIIVLTGDHGIRYDMHHFSTGHLAQKYQPFHAVYFPNQDYQHYPKKHSLVNTFAIISNQFLKTNFPILPHISFDEKGKKVSADSLQF